MFFSENGVDADNVLEIKTEKDYTNICIQNSIYVKDEIEINEEILTYQNDDDNNGSYHTEK